MAYGEQRYIQMAKTLGESLKLNSPQITRAVVTDSEDSSLKEVYDILIPLNPDYGKGFKQKLYIDLYSPFEETLFIDSDCIVVKNIDFWELFSELPFGVVSEGQRKQGEAFWNAMPDVAPIISRFKIDSISVFNGGLYYFKQTPLAREIFEKARELADRYDEIGLARLRGSRADEPVFAIALGLCGIQGIEDGGLTMRTPIKMIGPMEIDVLKGFCRFNSNGQEVKPAIVHFCGNQAKGFYYRREKIKLYLARKNSYFNHQTISFCTNLIFSPFYPVAVLNKFARRTIKKFFFPSLPRA